ncbi:hypothetical protein AK812_SmicGene42126 [Symbiodinium microadriaticum]|uniref:Uncharacterized protein n=1 Tax=Symbiodinium microadriaticum TaxID=2951 RepID=A0A1Q9C4C9_SYMMI|nr:hypothetical protein AK812_SmicGene42126 [Symbiodinium microadriaticum]
MSSSVRSRDPVVSRCEVEDHSGVYHEAADDTQDHHRRCLQAWRSSSLAAALGAGLGLAAAKALKLRAKVAYNTAFVTGSTAGAAIATVLLRYGRGHEGLAPKDGSLLVAAAFAAETFQQVVHNKFCSFLFRVEACRQYELNLDKKQVRHIRSGEVACIEELGDAKWSLLKNYSTQGEVGLRFTGGNVHNATGPRCPWCVARANISWTTDCLPLALMLLIFGEAERMHQNLAISTPPQLKREV